MNYYHTCPDCGANLDPGEKCDCREEDINARCELQNSQTPIQPEHKELNLVSWNGRDPIYDLRGWNEDHTKMTKGVTFGNEEYKELVNKLKEE